MNKNDSSKKESFRQAESTPRISHAVTLKTLGDNMVASGMSADHPWLLSIATALSGDEPILDAVDDIDRAAGVIGDLIKLALTQCADTGEAGSALRAARRYIADIGDATATISLALV